jgi:hypothetical protein
VPLGHEASCDQELDQVLVDEAHFFATTPARTHKADRRQVSYEPGVDLPAEAVVPGGPVVIRVVVFGDPVVIRFVRQQEGQQPVRVGYQLIQFPLPSTLSKCI